MRYLERFFDICGFPRSAGAHIQELDILAPFMPACGTMFDVGAHKGESFEPFHKKGWTIHAFEPDERLYGLLRKKTAGWERLYLDSRAVADKSGEKRPWHVSADSDGAGSMRPFTTSHSPAGSVETITLADVARARSVRHVDFLKIDAEGFDFMVLKGFPFNEMLPDFIICEYEDAKTIPLGYTVRDMISFLQNHGYDVFISEWHPIIRYGIRHQWFGFHSCPSEISNPLSWGNLLAFARPPDDGLLFGTVAEAIRNYN